MLALMKLTYDRERDWAYVELATQWKGDDSGWSNVSLMRTDDETVEVHFFFGGDDSLKAIGIRDASRWLRYDLLGDVEPFEHWDGSS